MNLSPLPKQKFFDNDGNPLVGGLLFTYAAGTSTKVATYRDGLGNVNTNPIVLDFRGEANIWLDLDIAYKFVLSPRGDTDPPTKPIWTVDGITTPVSLSDLTPAVIGQIIYPYDPDQDGSLTPTNYQFYYGNVLRYGVTGNGAVDDTVLIQTAFNSGLDLFFPAGVYLVTNTLTLKSQFQRIYGVGKESEIRFTFSSSRAALVLDENGATTFAEGTQIDHLYLHGTQNVLAVILLQAPISQIHNNLIRNRSSGVGHGIYGVDLNEVTPPFVESFGHDICFNYIYGLSGAIVGGSIGVRFGERNHPCRVFDNFIGHFDTLISVEGTEAVIEVDSNYLEPCLTIGVDINPPSGSSVLYNVHIHDNYFEEVPIAVALRNGMVYCLRVNDNYSYSHTAVSPLGPAPFFYVTASMDTSGQMIVENNTVETHSSIFRLDSANANQFASTLNNIPVGAVPYTTGTYGDSVYTQRGFNSYLLKKDVSGTYLGQSVARIESKDAAFIVPVMVSVKEKLHKISFTYSPNSGTGVTVAFKKSLSTSPAAAITVATVTVNTSITADILLNAYLVEPGYNYFLDVAYDNTGVSGYIYPFMLYIY